MSGRDTIVNALPTPLRKGLASARRGVLKWTRERQQPEVVSNHGIKVRVGEHVSPTIRGYLYDGSYEGGELKPLRMHLRPEDRVLEVGTGIGFVTLYCAKIVGPENVFTYEANPNNEAHIRENFRLNEMTPNLHIGMLSESGESETTFFADEEFWSSSLHNRESGAREITVPTIPLNAELDRVQPTCLVIDCEGGEYELFRDMKLDSVQKIVIELHPYIIGQEKVDQVRAWITEAGFKKLWNCDDDLHAYYQKS